METALWGVGMTTLERSLAEVDYLYVRFGFGKMNPLLMLHGYWDDSGNPADMCPQTVVTAGSIATTDTWKECHRQLLLIFDRYRVKKLHMTDLLASPPRGEYENWTRGNCDQFLTECIGVIKTHFQAAIIIGAVASTSNVRPPDGNGRRFPRAARINPASGQPAWLDTFEKVTIQAANACDGLPREETVKMIYDRQDEYGPRALALYGELQQDYPRLGSIEFGSSSTMTPLSISDFLTYALAEAYLQQFNSALKSQSRILEVLPDFHRHCLITTSSASLFYKPNGAWGK